MSLHVQLKFYYSDTSSDTQYLFEEKVVNINLGILISEHLQTRNI